MTYRYAESPADGWTHLHIAEDMDSSLCGAVVTINLYAVPGDEDVRTLLKMLESHQLQQKAQVPYRKPLHTRICGSCAVAYLGVNGKVSSHHQPESNSNVL